MKINNYVLSGSMKNKKNKNYWIKSVTKKIINNEKETKKVPFPYKLRDKKLLTIQYLLLRTILFLDVNLRLVVLNFLMKKIVLYQFYFNVIIIRILKILYLRLINHPSPNPYYCKSFLIINHYFLHIDYFYTIFQKQLKLWK